MRFPSINDVSAELRRINKDVQSEDDGDDGGVDVRLQVYPDSQWAVHWGSSDYDQDHRGYWGSSSVPGDNRRFDSKDIARDLIEQAREQKATGGDFEEAPARATKPRPVARTALARRTTERPKTHDDVEYAVDDYQGRQRTFKTFDEAAAFALGVAASGRETNLDVLIWSEEGAEWYGGDDAVDQYNEDPEASVVFERFEISVNNVGRVP